MRMKRKMKMNMNMKMKAMEDHDAVSRTNRSWSRSSYLFRWAIIVVLTGIVVNGCAPSAHTVTAVYATKERVRLGFRTIVIRELAEPWSIFERMSYTPVYRFELLDENGVQTHEWIGALHVERLIRKQPETVRIRRPTRLDSLRYRCEWQYSDTLRTVQSSEDIPVVFWSVDINREGVPAEAFRIPRADGATPMLRQRSDAGYMSAVQEEARRYVFYDLKSYVLSKVAEL
ncbi:MAG: hypothetical protein ACKOAG_08005 [Candidatus Kapaibacterium sp.]